jgi:hypothetical protein
VGAKLPEPLNEDQFKQNIYLKHREHFDHFYALLTLAEESMRTYRGFTGDHYQAALVLIFPRAFKSFDSVRRLCEVASCEDAAVVLRSLLNLMVVTRWISLNPQARASKYFAWYWIQMHRDAERAKNMIPPAWIADIEKHYKAIKAQFEYKDKKGNVKMPKHWYEPEAHSIMDLFKEVGLEKQYEEGYKPLSGIEHSDAMAYFAMVGGAEKKGGERKLEVQSDLFVPPYLRNGFQYFGDIFRICNKTNALADSQKLKRVIDAGMKFYEANMRATGLAPF